MAEPGRKAHLWGGQYARRIDDFHRLEDEILVDLAEQIRPELSRTQVDEIRKRYTNDGRAYQRYLKGRYFWNKRTADSVKKAVQHYRGALDQDAGFALAFAGIADAYFTLGTFLFASPASCLPAARAAAVRALEIEPRLGEAHAALAAIRAYYEWDWESGEREFQEAIALASKYPTARQWYGFALCARGHYTAGRALLQSAIDLDPLSPMLTAQLAASYYLERNYDAAIRICQDVLDLDPQFWAALLFLGQCHDAIGRLGEAVEYLRRAGELSSDNPLAMAGLGHALARAGDSAIAGALMSNLRDRSSTEYVPPYSFALICCGLGRFDEALTYLEQARDERSPALALWLKGEPRLDRLRSHPRFQNLLQSVGIA